MQAPPVTVLVVDDHPALRAGLKQLLYQEPGYRLLNAVSTEAELAAALRGDRVDVVVLDYALARGGGLSACFRLKQGARPPGVVLYSAYVDPVFAVPADHRVWDVLSIDVTGGRIGAVRIVRNPDKLRHL